MPAVTVIVPCRDAETTLPATLKGLSRQTFEGEIEVVVVDNGSRDATFAVAERSPVVDNVVRRARGDGPGAARNAGAAVGSGRTLAFVDADCKPSPDWLAAGLSAAESAGIVQGAILPAPAEASGPFDRIVRRRRLSPLYETANLFVDRAEFLRLGGFGAGLEDRRNGVLDAPFGEDVLFGWRARRAGLRTVFAADSVVYHAVIPRSAGDYVAEYRRLHHFAALGREVPELREEFFYRRYFLTRRSAAFDLAIAAATVAAIRRRPATLALTLPYCRAVHELSRPWGPRRGVQLALATVAADATGLVALVRGSASARWLLL